MKSTPDHARPREVSRCRATGAGWFVTLLVFFTTIILLTWRRWAVIAFPLDAGRELIVPQLIQSGQILYRDVRCFYGPLGYWLNAWFLVLFGGGTDGLWCVNVIRFAATIILLWMVARRLLTPSLAALAVSAFVLTLFRSFMVPYTAAVGWGGLLMLAALVGTGKWFSRGADTRTGRASLVVACGLLSLAAATKQEYTLAASVLLSILILDCWARSSDLRLTITAVAAAAIPFALVLAVVLSSVSLSTLVHENLWMPELLAYHDGSPGYGLLSTFTPQKIAWGVELISLLFMFAMIGDHWALNRGSRRPGEAVRPTPAEQSPNGCSFKSPPQNPCGTGFQPVGFQGSGMGSKPNLTLGVSLLVLVASICLAAAAEAYLRSHVPNGQGLFTFSKPRLRSLIEKLPILCPPLSMMAFASVSLCAWRKGPLQTWRSLPGSHRLGLACAACYMAFVPREICTTTELSRQPFTPIVFAWLLVTFWPEWWGWSARTRRRWTLGVYTLLIASTVIGLDNVAWYQTRPSVVLNGEHGSMFATQRRMPFTPRHFEDALQLTRDHESLLAGRTLACVPEGAWINALSGHRWPTRDTQWMPFCRRWIVEDLQQRPPDFILLMDTLENSGLKELQPVIESRYVPIAAGASGMTLLQHTGTSGSRNSLVMNGAER